MSVNPTSHIPIYEQIADYIRGAVAAGVFQPGELIPSVRTLALELVVNPNTVQRAYLELEREGLVVKRKGLGVTVADNGAAKARRGSEAVIESRFEQGIHAGQAANLDAREIASIFRKTLKQATTDSAEAEPVETDAAPHEE
jgi:GntR family transcriptional regulator